MGSDLKPLVHGVGANRQFLEEVHGLRSKPTTHTTATTQTSLQTLHDGKSIAPASFTAPA